MSDVARPWANPEETLKFFNDHRGESIEDTKKLLMTVTSTKDQKSASTSSVNWGSNWLDKDDLEDLFKSKPEQLANILEHANTMYHPHRKVTPYQVMHVQSNGGQATSVEEKHVQQVQSQIPDKKNANAPTAKG